MFKSDEALGAEQPNGDAMALPLVPIAIAIAQGTAHVLTKPWPWALLGVWFVVSNVSLGAFFKQVQDTVWSLWWVVALIIIGLIANSTLKIYVAEHGKTKRFQIRQQTDKK